MPDDNDMTAYRGWLPPKLVEVILALFISLLSFQAWTLIQATNDLQREVSSIKNDYVRKDDYMKTVDRIYILLDRIDDKLDGFSGAIERNKDGND